MPTSEVRSATAMDPEGEAGPGEWVRTKAVPGRRLSGARGQQYEKEFAD